MTSQAALFWAGAWIDTAPEYTACQLPCDGWLALAGPAFRETSDKDWLKKSELAVTFLDRYGNNGLAGTVAVPVMTGGWPGHLLAVEVHLRPVLVELGATVPARGLFVTEPELADLRPGELQHSSLDASLAEREFGWKPEVPIAEGLRQTYASLVEEFER